MVLLRTSAEMDSFRRRQQNRPTLRDSRGVYLNPSAEELSARLHSKPVEDHQRLGQNFFDAVDDALEKSLAPDQFPLKGKAAMRVRFSNKDLWSLERFTGLDLLRYKPRWTNVGDEGKAVFSYIDLKIMIFKAVQENGSNLPFYYNYLQHRKAELKAKEEIPKLEAQLKYTEVKAARELMGSTFNKVPQNKGLDLEDIKDLILRSGIPANYFLCPQIKLRDVKGKAPLRSFSKNEVYRMLLEATLTAERPAPYVYYHTNVSKSSKPVSFDDFSHHGHRLDHYGAESRSACMKGRYIWTRKVFNICKLIGVDPKTLSWDQFMAMVDKVSEIATRSLKHNDRISRRVRHVLSEDELHELCRSLGISQKYLLGEESKRQAQERILVGGCGPALP